MRNDDKVNKVLDDVTEQYYEWLEMAGENAPLLLARIVAQMFLKSEEDKCYLKKELMRCSNQLTATKSPTTSWIFNREHKSGSM